MNFCNYIHVNDNKLIFLGHHLLSIEYGGRKEASSPYTIKVYDALQVKLGRINDGLIGKTFQFTGRHMEIWKVYYLCLNLFFFLQFDLL